MKNQIETVRIEDINPDGNGVARLQNGSVVFVPLTAPGDLCEIKIIKELSSYSIGRVEKIIEPSQVRINVSCPVYNRCGSCNFLHLSMQYENEKKREIVRNALMRIGKINAEVKETVCPVTDRYRNKVVYPIREADKEHVFGYYARHSHSLIPHDTCNLQQEIFDKIAMFHVKQLQKYHIPAWDEKTQTGIVKHLAMRRSQCGKILVTIVASKRFQKEKEIALELIQEFKEIVGVSININAEPGNVIFGDKTFNLAGEAVIHDTLCDIEFEISPCSFYQVNAKCAELLYSTARSVLELDGTETILDLFCGIGTIGISVSELNNKLFGIEIVSDAVRNANINASLAGRDSANTRFVCCDADIGFHECAKAFGKPDVVIVDPPRKGLSNEVLASISANMPEKLLYISCDPATLASNAAFLVKHDYEIATVIPFNMFPRTGHVETLILFKNKQFKS